MVCKSLLCTSRFFCGKEGKKMRPLHVGEICQTSNPVVAEFPTQLRELCRYKRPPLILFNPAQVHITLHNMADERAEKKLHTEALESNQQEQWVQEQELLKKRLVLEDDFSWKILPSLSIHEESARQNRLHYIGGVDLSFSKDDPSIACGAFVVVDLDTLCVVYEDFDVVHLTMPYIPGFLAFRECPVLLGLLTKMRRESHPFYPQLLMVDGNGILHPRGFGLACHLAVLSDLPCIGIGKNLHHIDGLRQMAVKKHFARNTQSDGDLMPLIGKSGRTWGAAFRSNERSSKPIFISIGHRISLETAIAVVKMCCKYRVPEPIRQADIRSKEFMQKKLVNGH